VGLGSGPNVSRLGTFLRGRRIYRGEESRRALRKKLKTQCEQDGTGLEILDGAPFSLELECKHTFAIGGVGSGKSAYIFRMLSAARARGDKILLHDVKGDFTAKLHGAIVLLAPHDSRSAIWDIARDVRSESDAIELASRLVPEGKDPFWAQAAQSLLIGWTIYLMRERAEKWGWADLAELSEITRERIVEVMTANYPAALTYVKDDTAMTQSVLASLKAPLTFVRQLGQAWPSNDSRPRFSFTDWLTTDRPTERLVIFQSAPHLPKLSAAWINSAVQLAGSFAVSPALPDNPRSAPLEKQRRIWFVLDELPVLKKLPAIETVIAVGRSKGLRVLGAVQAWEQLTQLYGQEMARAWLSMTGTLLALYSKGDSAETLSKVFGDSEFEVIRKSQTLNSKKEISSSYAPQLEKRRVLLPSDFEKLGKQKISTGESGIVGYLLVGGDGYEIEYSFVRETRYREESVPAEWTFSLTEKGAEHV
jgi:type IV secretory pathway TraG/TraD family ATPase VirD4